MGEKQDSTPVVFQMAYDLTVALEREARWNENPFSFRFFWEGKTLPTILCKW